MAEVMRKIWEHRGKRFSRASSVAFYLVKETLLRTFEEPVAADLIKANSVTGDDQGPEQLRSQARDVDDRMLEATIPGAIDHGEKTISMEIRTPSELTGASTIMGAAAFESVLGDERIVNAQAKVAIDSIVSHDRTATVVRITAGDEDFHLGDLVALRSRNTQSAHAANEVACVVNVADGGATADLTLKPAFSGEPYTAGGTPDQIQGGITWKPTTDYLDTWSSVWEQGFDGDAAQAGVVPSCSIPINKRDLLTVEFPYHFIRSFRSAIGFVSGESGNDSFLTTDTVLDVDDAALYQVGALVNLVKFTRSTGVIAGTETKAKVTAIDETSSPNTITLTRGATPVAQTGGAQDLKAATLLADAEDLVAGVVIGASEHLAFWIDHRGYIEVPLTVGGSDDVAQLVSDIHTALKYDANYAQVSDSPYGPDADYSSGVASEDTTGGTSKLVVTSKSFGSQSQVKPVKTGKAGDRFDDVWVPADTFERLSDSEVQIVPWTPGGTETRDPIVGKDAVCRIDGYKHRLQQATFTVDNQIEHLEDIKDGTDYSAGHLEGIERLSTCAITSPADGWTVRLRRMAERADGVVFLAQVGSAEGDTFSVCFTKARASSVNKEGDNRQDRSYTLTAENPKVTYTATGGNAYTLRDVYIGIT